MAEKKEDGGPAFPMYSEIGSLHSEGVSIRDYFAAAALQGMCCTATTESGAHLRDYAFKAYDLADAMLYVRGNL